MLLPGKISIGRHVHDMLAETIYGAVFDLVVELLGAGALNTGHDLLGMPAGFEFIPDELR